MLWINNAPGTYKWHLLKEGRKDVAICGTGIDTLVFAGTTEPFAVTMEEDDILIKTALCKICLKLRGEA
jgi:hypothetical protein